MGEEPAAVRNSSMKEATEKLTESVNNFFTFFGSNPNSKTIHPVFGPLNFDEWVMLHYKHVNHHLRQFKSK
jgi:hypothetical protein